MNLYEDLIQCFCFVFCMTFRQLQDYLGNLELLRPNIRREKEKEPPPGGQVSGWTCRTCAQKFIVYLLKTAGTFRLLCGKHVHFV